MSTKNLKKILVGEDEADIRAIFQLALEDMGQFTVKFCISGREVLAEAEMFAPDLILLDMMMPEMDGIAILAELRKREKLKNTPVIFVTAKAQTSEITYYYQLGALDVIVKPFDPMTLAHALQKSWERA